MNGGEKMGRLGDPQEAPWLRKIMYSGTSHVVILPHEPLKRLGLLKGATVVIREQGNGLYLERLYLPNLKNPAQSLEQVREKRQAADRRRYHKEKSSPTQAPSSVTNDRPRS